MKHLDVRVAYFMNWRYAINERLDLTSRSRRSPKLLLVALQIHARLRVLFVGRISGIGG